MRRYNGYGSEEDDDILILNPKSKSKNEMCPLTMKKVNELDHAVKNVNCPHIYEREAIKSYKRYHMKNNKRLKCPQAACSADLVLWSYYG